MLPFSTWREVFRIPWVRENSEAVHLLSDLFYLLIALFRTQRLQDFNRLRCVYFEMIDSFAQYGRSEAKDTVDQLLQIPWFREHHRDLYRLIGAYARVIEVVSEQGKGNPCAVRQERINRNVEDFVRAFKALTHFDEKDEGRVAALVAQPELMDAILENIFSSLG